MTARFIIEGDLPPDDWNQYAPKRPAAITVRRRNGVNGTVTVTSTRRSDGDWLWVLSGEAIPVHGRTDFREFDGNTRTLKALRAAKAYLLGLDSSAPLVPPSTKPRKRPGQAARETQAAVARAKVRESKAKYMRKWRAAHPELAAQKNREHVAAHRARRRAAASEG